MQQQGGQYGHMAPATSLPPATTQMMGGTAVDNQIVEEASPISSRPPAGNLDELMHAEEEAGDRGGAGGVGSASGNRWPKQETLALLKIRSEMDAVFRDAPLKGPLWEDVSRKLAELGYKRSAKKCKEKFENVHKYYKRTKEGRAGRQDGKSYKFFSELEALHTNTSTVATTNVSSSLAMAAPHVSTNPSASSTNFVPLGFGISTAAPMPLSSVHTTTITFTPQTQQLPSSNNIGTSKTMIPPSMTATAPTQGPPTQAAAAGGVSFSSNSTSSSHGTEDDNGGDEEGGEEMEERSNGKRKRASMSKGGGGSTSSNGGGSGSRSMMEFFENLMRQVMQKQESMQQRFLEAIEKGEQDRMIREEAWKRQEMARLTREREIMAQERAIAAQRDAAIISFVQKITGQAIQLPRHASAMPSAPAAPPPPQPAPVPTPTPTVVQDAPLAQPHHQHKQQQPQQQQVAPQQMQHQSRPSTEVVRQTSSKSTDVVMAVPEQQVPPQEASGGGGSFEQSPSRWPKAEVLALINIRSGLEYRYQEAVPKGPLWEEVSAGMARLGYNRNAKRCKEKWENINKYYKKMKESNKKRPEDAKTCPYFHQLDALYRQKLLGNTGGGGGSSSTSGLGNENRPQQHLQDRSDIPMLAAQPSQAAEPENKNGSSDNNNNNQASNVNLPGSLFGEETGGAAQKPEDIVKELMDQPQNHQHLTVDDYDKVDEPDHSDNLDQDEYEDDDQEDNEELQEQRKMAYKIEFQRQSNAGPPNGGNGKPSFLAMVQ